MESFTTGDGVCSDEDISKLLTHFVKNNHRVKTADITGETVMELCTLLFARDYKYTVIPNLSGDLCSHYPMKILITEFEKSANLSLNECESIYNITEVLQMMKTARCARCRSRFVVPVIYFEGKHICRSATLAGAAEMFGRSTSDYFMSNQNAESSRENGRHDMFNKFRGNDIRLMKYFDIGYICDLMVEKKKTKFGVPITSSEKVDKENRYSDFIMLCMPYPGCEFFKDWKDNFYSGETTMYDWELSLNDSSLDLPQMELIKELGIEWNKYKEWHITALTQNYMKLLLKVIKEGTSGLLVHCISGWDRTPLFISLLRLSLWADGLIHTSLNPTEMLYLTLGYDWYLFGHDLPERLSNDQEVMFFCFKVLKDIASDDFSLCPQPRPMVVNQGISQAKENATKDQASCSKGSFGPSSHSLRQAPHTATPPPPTSSSSSFQQHANPLSTTSQRSMSSHCRRESDSSLTGVSSILLESNLSTRGSGSSLNSLGSLDGTGSDPIKFLVGDIQEEVGTKEEIEKGSGDGSQIKSTSIPHCSTPIGKHSSPVQSARRRRRSSEGQNLSYHSNHFVGSGSPRATSPVCVPGMEKRGMEPTPSSGSLSVGSWQIIPSVDNMAGATSSHSHSSGKLSNLDSCQEVSESAVTSMRWQRLDAVSRLFQSIYIRAVPSAHVRTSSVGAGFTSLLDRFAEQVGFRGGNSNNSNTRRGV